MALIVQNNAGDVVGANGYITVAFFREYHGERNVDLSDYGDDTQVGGAIILATDYMDTSRRYKGSKLAVGQTTELPREDLYDLDGNLVVGLVTPMQRACAEYTLRALKGQLAPDPEVSASGQAVQSKTEKVGPLEETTTYNTTASLTLLRPYPAADLLLRAFVLSNSRRVIR